MRPPVLLFAKPKTARTPNVALGRVRSLVVQVQNQNGPIKSFAVLSANRRRGGYRLAERRSTDLVPRFPMLSMFLDLMDTSWPAACARREPAGKAANTRE